MGRGEDFKLAGSDCRRYATLDLASFVAAGIRLTVLVTLNGVLYTLWDPNQGFRDCKGTTLVPSVCLQRYATLLRGFHGALFYLLP